MYIYIYTHVYIYQYVIVTVSAPSRLMFWVADVLTSSFLLWKVLWMHTLGHTDNPGSQTLMFFHDHFLRKDGCL